MSSGRPRAVGNIHFFVLCQIDVVNKQTFCPLSWNNSLSKTALHQSDDYTDDGRYLDAKKKHSLNVERVCNLSPTWLPQDQL